MKNKILSLSMGSHDSSYAIFENNNLVIHEELERINRIKETNECIITYLESIGHFLDDFDYVLTFPHNDYIFYSPKYLEYKSKNPNKCIEVGHHTSHAANAFFSSDFNNSLILTIDGGGWDVFDGNMTPSTLTMWEGSENNLNLLYHSYEPNLGGIWSDCVREIFNLSSGGPPYGSQAGTVMAMTSMSDEILIPERPFNQYSNSDTQTKFNLAAGIQKITEDVIYSLLKEYLEKYKYENLCVSGGVALNCVMMGKIKSWFPEIKNVFVPPVPYDAGLAIGCTQYYLHSVKNIQRPKDGLYNSPYLGRKYDKDLVIESIKKNNLQYEIVTDELVIDLLINKNIISVFGGGSESGRRALGNRSILADPRHSDIKDLINQKVKHRQNFRPFAPSILKDYVSEWFVEDVDSPYMSFAIPFKNEKKHLVPAVVHLDGTGRLQTVTKKNNEWYYNFINIFNNKTGVPILLNTSFNDKEPIVETPKDAINCFLNTEINYLYFREFNILVKKNYEL
jgi:carbamoyltransferase